MTAFATDMFLVWIKDGTVPLEDLKIVVEAIYQANPSLKPLPMVIPRTIGQHPQHATVGNRARIKQISPKYLVGIEGLLGREPGQHGRYALYVDPAGPLLDKRAAKYMRASHYAHGKKYISVTMNMLEPA